MFRSRLIPLITLVLPVLAYAVVPTVYGAKGETGDKGRAGAFSLSRSLNDVWVDSEGVIWIATNAGLGRSPDGGNTWYSFSEEQGLPGGNCNAVWAEGSEIFVQVLSENFGDTDNRGLGLCYSADGGSTWRVIGKEQGLPADGEQEVVWDVLRYDGVLWVALWNGGIGRSDDNGASWELITPPDRLGHPGEHFYAIDKEGDLIWAAAQVIYIDPDTPELSYNITGVYKSEDNGVNWTFYGVDEGLVGDFFPIVYIQEGPTEEDFVWVGTAHPSGPSFGEGRGVNLSRDGGVTWENYTSQQGMGGDTAYALGGGSVNFYAGNINTGVSRTTDYGNTWTHYLVESEYQSDANDIYSMFVDVIAFTNLQAND